MTEHDTTGTDITVAAQSLQHSLEEMTTLTEQLSSDMSEVADGFESFGESTATLRESRSAQIDTTPAARSGYAGADD